MWGLVEEVTITIKNWDKYNPKRDQKNYTWLRLDNDISNDTKLFGLTAAQKFMWVHLLCLASKANRADIFIDLRQLERALEIDLKSIRDALEFLERRNILSVVYTTGTIIQTTPTYVRTYERTNERTNERTDTVCTEVEQVPTSGAIDGLQEDAEVLAFLETVKHDAQERWLKLYPDIDWVKREILKMIAWLENNPKKRPKSPRGKSGFITSWLARGWEQYRKSIPTVQPGPAPVLPIVACDKCDKGLVRATNKSSGATEYCSCTCSAGRAKDRYTRFDENRFERVG